MHCCSDALLRWCTVALMHCCIDTLLRWCTVAVMHWWLMMHCCTDAMLLWCTVALMHCCTVALIHCCGNALLFWCTVAEMHCSEMHCCGDALLHWCTVALIHCCGDELLQWFTVVVIHCCSDTLLHWYTVAVMHCCTLSICTDCSMIHFHLQFQTYDWLYISVSERTWNTAKPLLYTLYTKLTLKEDKTSPLDFLSCLMSVSVRSDKEAFTSWNAGLVLSPTAILRRFHCKHFSSDHCLTNPLAQGKLGWAAFY